MEEISQESQRGPCKPRATPLNAGQTHLYALVYEPQRLGRVPQQVGVLRQIEPRPEQRLGCVVRVMRRAVLPLLPPLQAMSAAKAER